MAKKKVTVDALVKFFKGMKGQDFYKFKHNAKAILGNDWIYSDAQLKSAWTKINKK